MKCKIHKCLARCCYNVPFESGELTKYADKIVNPILFTQPIGPFGTVAFTDDAPSKNKCPFLRSDYKCNIYEQRPPLCRKFGEIPELPCKFKK